jgi:LPXTG-site transpeptidase (sortase) family protein
MAIQKKKDPIPQPKKSLVLRKDILFLILGSALILFAAFNLVQLIYSNEINQDQIPIPADQLGFVPLYVPQGAQETLSAQQGNLPPKYIPDRIVIPAIGLDAPVEVVHASSVTLDNQTFLTYLVPEKFAAGWDEGSAGLGEKGNTVLDGHHNAFGQVFGKLVDLNLGDLVQLYSGGKLFEYSITNKMILPERGQSLQTRLNNARWLMSSNDERITLVTCWPNYSNTHRLIIVALPRKQTNS